MLVCGALTLLLAVVLAVVTSLPIATIALVVIRGPAGVGSSMLYAHLRHSGGRPADVVNTTRAIVPVAGVVGPRWSPSSSVGSATAPSCSPSPPWRSSTSSPPRS
jgi:hypothetical protein